jgi:hypothetical protein
MIDSSLQVAQRIVTAVAENNFAEPIGRNQYALERQQSTHIAHPSGPFQEYTPGSKDPIYVLDPQKPHASPDNEAVVLDGSSNARPLPMYRSPWPHNANLEGRNPQDARDGMQTANTRFVVSNDARLHYDHRHNRPECGASAIPWHPRHTARKASWQDSDPKRDNTIFVAGFPFEGSPSHWLVGLFSSCGVIINIHIISLKRCAFIR